jgi:hypothetical protein
MAISKTFRAFVLGALALGAVLAAVLPLRSIAQNAGQLIFTPTGQELIQVIPPNTAAIAYVPLAAVRDGAQYVYNVPLTGFTIVMTAEQSVVSLNPAGTLATGTVTLPPTLYDGKIATIFSSADVTLLTVNTSNGATFAPAAPAAILTANTSRSYIYDKANNQWHRFQ